MGIIFHIDVNSAFLSWSAVKMILEGATVDIREVPSIVGGDQESRHGIVVAKSIPAKAYGITTAETVASAMAKCPNLVVVKPDYYFYKSQSESLMNYLRNICPDIQQVSVDECYMDYEPIRRLYDSPEECAKIIKDGVRETLGFTVNVGISDRKVLAKMASDFKKPDLVHTLYANEIKEKMWPLPIGDLYMCGKSSAARLQQFGVKTIGDLAKLDLEVARQLLKSQGVMLWEFANGIDESVVETKSEPPKGIGHSTTVPKDLTRREEAIPILKELTKSTVKRLKKQGFRAGQVSVEIKYADFKSFSHQTTLFSESDDVKLIFDTVTQLFDDLWDGNPIRLLGVRVTKFVDASAPVQMDLFSYQNDKEVEEKTKRADDAMEAILQRFGDNAIQKGIDI